MAEVELMDQDRGPREFNEGIIMVSAIVPLKPRNLFHLQLSLDES